ncbi:MAG: type III-A CRISPR-associated RAMP protein Csm5 [bacterium]
MKIRIRTITPILVRSGEEISNVNECIIDSVNKELKIIDKDKLINIFKKRFEDPRPLITELSSLILSDNKTIEDFLRRKEIDINQVIKYSIKIKSDIDKERRRSIYLPMITDEKAYIPGSTLKGIIRNALLFYYLENNKDIQKELLSKKDVYTSKKNVYIGEDILRVEIKRMETDTMRFIIVRDTDGIPVSDLALYRIERLPQKAQRRDRGQGLYQYIIAIPNKKDFSTEIIVKVSEKDDIPVYWKEFLSDKDKENNIWIALKIYSTKLVDKEIEILERLKSVRKEGLEVFDSLINYYKEVQKLLKNPQNKTLYIPIGFGKTYYFNSLGYFIPEASFKTFKIIKTDIDPKLYPSTRWVVKIGERYYPIGGCGIVRE